MGSLLALAAQGFTVGLTGAMIPGPLLVFTIQQTLRRSVAVGLLIVLGHIIVESVLVLAVVFGLHVLVVDRPAVTRWISGVGGVVLLGMGIAAAGGAREPEEKEEGEGRAVRSALGGGMALTLFNPGFPLWWFTIEVTFLLAAMSRGPAAVAAFMAGHWASDLGWYAAVSYSAARGGRLVRGAAYLWTMRALGAALAAFGLLFILRAARPV